MKPAEEPTEPLEPAEEPAGMKQSRHGWLGVIEHAGKCAAAGGGKAAGRGGAGEGLGFAPRERFRFQSRIN